MFGSWAHWGCYIQNEHLKKGSLQLKLCMCVSRCDKSYHFSYLESRWWVGLNGQGVSLVIYSIVRKNSSTFSLRTCTTPGYLSLLTTLRRSSKCPTSWLSTGLTLQSKLYSWYHISYTILLGFLTLPHPHPHCQPGPQYLRQVRQMCWTWNWSQRWRQSWTRTKSSSGRGWSGTTGRAARITGRSSCVPDGKHIMCNIRTKVSPPKYVNSVVCTIKD